jgi:NAD(P)-dependent dehydrogenase (short-subunit alcohol dehydrogenase family)
MHDGTLKIKDATALVTGANRGLGRQLAEQLLDRGARRLYATALTPASLASLVALSPERVVPLQLDITDDGQVAAAAAAAPDVRLVINNAGVMSFGAPLEVDLSLIEHNFTTNCCGTLRITRAFAPVLEANGGGTILNVLSMLALAPITGMSAYCASKAAAHSLTQALRTQLAPRGIFVAGAYPGAMDTAMMKDADVPKADPATVARAILDGLEAGRAEIAPDAFSAQAYETWLHDPQALERDFAAL